MKARADADFYTAQKQAESHKVLLSKEYLELKRIEAVAHNNKIYYGSNIPSVFFDSHVLGQSTGPPFTGKHPK